MSPPAQSRTHYEILGVSTDCTPDELRNAYRRLAWAAHPDVQGFDGVRRTAVPTRSTMAEINEAWRVLSSPDRRQHYDRTVLALFGAPASNSWAHTTRDRVGPNGRPRSPFGIDDLGISVTQPASRRARAEARRQAWVAGLQAQMARLARQAGRSATQTLLIRNPRGPRSDYEPVVDDLVRLLSQDVESRVRAARAAGAAPLDLGVAATLVGVRSVADGIRRKASLQVTRELLMSAELLDRMWDVIAHELPAPLTIALGGNPHVAKAVYRFQNAG